jgi:hypothetical protein
MRFGQTLCRAAGAVCCVLASQTWAAAPDSIPIAAVPEAPAQSSGLDYTLETEMVVHGWVLCVSASGAEELARARAESLETARAAYASLSGKRACGEFPELRVILREKLYESGAGSEHDARAFGALINLSGDWADAFVVSGGLSAD